MFHLKNEKDRKTEEGSISREGSISAENLRILRVGPTVLPWSLGVLQDLSRRPSAPSPLEKCLRYTIPRVNQ